MNTKLLQTLAQTKLYSDHVLYGIRRWPRDTEFPGEIQAAIQSSKFGLVLRDKDECTIVLPLASWRKLPIQVIDMICRKDRLDGYRLISLDLVLAPTLTGYLARIAGVLAGSGIPILAFSSFSRDHLLVRSKHFEKAWQILLKEIDAARNGIAAKKFKKTS